MAHPDLIRHMVPSSDDLDYSKFRAFEALNNLSAEGRMEIFQMFCLNCGLLDTDPNGCLCKKES